MRRLEDHVKRLTEQCEVESAVRCDSMHACARTCSAGRPRLSLSHYDACRCARTSRRACASSVPAPCSSAGGAPTRKRAPTRRRRPRGAPRPARAPRPRATRRRCHGGTRSDLPHPTQHHCSLGPHSRSHPHATPGGAARAAGRARVRGTGGARRVPAATLRDGGCSPMPRWWRPYCDPACRPMCSQARVACTLLGGEVAALERRLANARAQASRGAMLLREQARHVHGGQPRSPLQRSTAAANARVAVAVSGGGEREAKARVRHSPPPPPPPPPRSPAEGGSVAAALTAVAVEAETPSEAEEVRLKPMPPGCIPMQLQVLQPHVPRLQPYVYRRGRRCGCARQARRAPPRARGRRRRPRPERPGRQRGRQPRRVGASGAGAWPPSSPA